MKTGSTEAEYLKSLKTANSRYAIEAIKSHAVRRDKKGRAYYLVPSSSRRNGQMIISQASIKKFLKNGDITQQDIDNIRPY